MSTHEFDLSRGGKTSRVRINNFLVDYSGDSVSISILYEIKMDGWSGEEWRPLGTIHPSASPRFQVSEIQAAISVIGSRTVANAQGLGVYLDTLAETLAKQRWGN
jgi:hypothetical protein